MTTSTVEMDTPPIPARELVHVGTWSWEPVTDRVWWSDELFRLLGVEPQSMPLRFDTYLAFVHPDDRERVAAIVRRAFASKRSFEFESRVVTRDGEVRVHHSRGSIICNADGAVTAMIGAAFDVTEGVQQEIDRKTQGAQFQALFAQSAVGMALTDLDQRFVRVNDSFARFLGYTPAELIGRSVLEVTHPEDTSRTREQLGRQEEHERSLTYEKRYLRKDGSAVWGRATVNVLRDSDGNRYGLAGVIEDITEHRRANDELASQTELLRGILDHLPVMVSIFDTAGRPTYVNREWQRVMGWSLVELRGVDLFTAVYPEASDRERALRCVERGEASWIEFEPMVRDGHRIQSIWASITLSDGSHLTIGKDLSEVKLLQKQLTQAQKMEALGQLAGGVAHDFNNILTIISACATFVLEESGTNKAIIDDTREIQAAVARASALTRQLLAFSRRQMLQPEIVNVNQTVQGLAKTLNRLIGENIELAIVTRAESPTVEADVHQLEQVLLNLVVNSRDAIRDTGTITLETRIVPREASSPDPVDSVVISVADTGEGIAPEIRHRIFEPFFTTKPVGKGTGLGLATVLGIVEQSGGRIEMDSAVGSGTVFRILLPLVDAVSCPVQGDMDTEQLGGHETILLAEDESALRGIARRVLVSLGYTVLEARHGADAAQLSARHAGPIDLLITDVVMPELGGRELARLIRTHRPDTPVLYISGYTDDELLRKGILEPGAQLLRKPFAPADLARVVRDLLRGTRPADRRVRAATS